MNTTDEVEKVRLEIRRLKLNEETQVFIGIGNYSPFKNFSLLAKAFKRLEKEKQNALEMGKEKKAKTQEKNEAKSR